MDNETVPAAAGPPGIASDDCARLAAVVKAFGEIIDGAGENGDLDSLLGVLTDRACRLASVNRCAVYLLDDESGVYREQASRVAGRFDQRASRRSCGVEADRFTKEILATQRPVLIADALRTPAQFAQP